MTHDHTHPSHTSHAPWTEPPEELIESLDLEAKLSRRAMNRALDEAVSALAGEPSLIVDLGAGTGVGTVALASRFTSAQIRSIDISAPLLHRLNAVAVAAGVADRIETHLSDLESDWSSHLPQQADLMWASLSLHHVPNPAQVLRQAFEALRPGGVLIVTEMAGAPKIEPEDLTHSHEGLWDRLNETPAEQPNPSATDWTHVLDEVGFTLVGRQDFTLAATAATSEGSRFLAMQLQSHRERLADTLPHDALAALDTAIEEVHSGMSDLTFTADRAVWVAARPDQVKASALSDLHSGAIEPGIEGQPQRDSAMTAVDIVVVGGGVAGLAAAVVLARSRRSVAVIDAGQPRNAAAEGAHNVLGQEGIPPQELLARGRAEAETYGVQIIPGLVTGGSGSIDDFTIEIDQGARQVTARRVILATGLVDDLPVIPGVEEAWGRTVLHCAFCHGWEVRDRRIAILVRDEVAMHHVIMFRQLSDQVTLFLHEGPDPTEEQWQQLAALNVPVVRPSVERLIVHGTQVQSVEIKGGKTFATDAVVIAPRYNARTELYEALGGQSETTPFGQQIPTDPQGLTAIPGIWAAGNAAQTTVMIMASAASGVMTGSAVHAELGFADLTKAICVSSSQHAE